MRSVVARNHLVYPAAVVLALGAGTVAQPNPTASSPRLAEVSTIRLQAEVTGFVSGLSEATVAGVASAPSTAAPVAPAAATASAVGDPWPSTFLDKLVASLPPQIQSIILPPLYVVMTVVGVIMGAFYLVFGFPKDLMPAAAVAPARPRGAAASAAAETLAARDDSPATSATPGVSPGSDATAGHTAASSVVTPAEVSEGPAGARPTRGRQAAPVDAEPVAVTGHAAPPLAAAAIAEAPASEQVPPAVAVTPDELAVAEAVEPAPVEPAPVATPAQESAVAHPARARARSADSGSADSAPARAVRRSAQ